MKRKILNIKKIISKRIELRRQQYIYIDNKKNERIKQKIIPRTIQQIDDSSSFSLERKKMRSEIDNSIFEIKKSEKTVENNPKILINKNNMDYENNQRKIYDEIFLTESETYPINFYEKIFNEEFNLVENIKLLFIISNYEREEMLKNLLSEIKKNNNEKITIDYIIFDDVSSYKMDDPNFIINDSHRGKYEYWKTFNEMFKYCENTNYDIYVFTPNDFQNYKFERIFEYGMKLKEHYYIFNIINDGRTMCWNNKSPINITNEVRLQYFTDCGFFTNYKTIMLLEFKVNEINHKKKISNSTIGSLVGSQLTNRLNKLKVPIFTPINSIAYHGGHSSLMNPIEREKNKLISI